jgi:hypothetical protein
MRLGTITLTLNLVFSSAAVLAAGPADPLLELQDRIAAQLADEKWNEAGKAFVRALVQDYSSAHLSSDANGVAACSLSRSPDVASLDEYVGSYSLAWGSQNRSLRVTKSEVGRFFVDLDGRHIPAVARNRTIVFTTGDVVCSDVATVGAKPYCTLEMFTVLRTGGRFYLAALATHPETWIEMKAQSAAASATGSNLAIGNQLQQIQEQYAASFKSVTAAFWEKDFPDYALNKTIRDLTAKIHNADMVAFLKARGIQVSPAQTLAPANLVAYLRSKKLGTEAVYAWLDLLKGNPDFQTATQDLETIQKERGFEPVPAYCLLSSAKLASSQDAEAWFGQFKAAFTQLSGRDSDMKVLVLFCLVTRIPGDLKDVEPPVADRLAFLTSELRKPDTSTLYRQGLVLALFEASLTSQRLREAAAWAEELSPPATGLLLAFLCRTMGKELDAATSTLSRLEKVNPQDGEMLTACRAIVHQLQQAKEREGALRLPQTR